MASPTILVVEGQPDLRQLIETMLSRSSFQVLTAGSEKAALNVLRSNSHVDLVISEMDLPGGNGADLIDSVRQSSPSTAVMLMTPHTDAPLDPGVPVIEKPFTVDVLLQRVRKALEESRGAAQKLDEAVARARHLAEESSELREQVQESVSFSRDMRREGQLRRNAQKEFVVLLVENDPVFRHTVSDFLSRRGFIIIEAATNDEALRAWCDQRERISVVLTDVAGADGLPLVRTVESDCPGKPIVLMAGAEIVLPHPMLRKPFELEDLLAMLRAYCWTVL